MIWAASAVNGFLLFCVVTTLYFAYQGLGLIGVAVFGMVLLAVPGYILSQMAAGQWAEARVRVGAGPSRGPKWTRHLPEARRPAPVDDADE